MGAKHSQQAMMPQQPTTHPLTAMMPQQPTTHPRPLFASCTAETFSDCEYMYRLVIVGDTCSGRTCCLRRFNGIETFSETVFTVGADYMVRYVTLNDIRIKLLMWEVSGQSMKQVADIRSTFYRSAQGVLVVYDTTSVKTFDNMQYWMDEIKQNCHPETVVMLVGNKCDLAKEVSHETAKEFADEHNLTFFEVSAKDGTNTELVLLSLVAQIRQKHCELEPNS